MTWRPARRPECAARECPRLADDRRDVGNALNIEAVDEQDGGAEEKCAELQPADRLGVDDVRDVDLVDQGSTSFVSCLSAGLRPMTLQSNGVGAR